MYVYMVDQSKETSLNDVRGLASRFKTADRLWDMRTEEEKRMGLLVRRFEDGEPIRLKVSGKTPGGAEVSTQRYGDRSDVSTKEVPLRLNLRDVDVPDYRWKTIVIPTNDPHETFFLQFERPFRSADGRRGNTDIFVRPLEEADAIKQVESGNSINYQDLLSQLSKELMGGHEVVGVIGAQPLDIRILNPGSAGIGR